MPEVEHRHPKRKPYSAHIGTLERRIRYLQTRVRDPRFKGTDARNFDMAELQALHEALPAIQLRRSIAVTETEPVDLIRHLSTLLRERCGNGAPKSDAEQDWLEVAGEFLAAFEG